jgi:hypothetical protein
MPTPQVDFDKARRWILDNLPVDLIDYTRTEFESDVAQRIESYPNFPKSERDKVWNAVKSVRETEEDIERIEERAEERQEDRGYLERVRAGLGRVLDRIKGWLGRSR